MYKQYFKASLKGKVKLMLMLTALFILSIILELYSNFLYGQVLGTPLFINKYIGIPMYIFFMIMAVFDRTYFLKDDYGKLVPYYKKFQNNLDELPEKERLNKIELYEKEFRKIIDKQKAKDKIVLEKRYKELKEAGEVNKYNRLFVKPALLYDIQKKVIEEYQQKEFPYFEEFLELKEKDEFKDNYGL